jgi:membrane-bound ClpP family serine protease
LLLTNNRLLAVFLFLAALVSHACAEGILLNVSLPITGKSAHAVVRTLEQIKFSGENPTLILQFKVENDEELFGCGSSFGACYEIADYLASEKMNGIRTVAYFPQSVKGHALLTALACQERIIAENAEIGEAGIDETKITDTQREAYHEIAKRRAIPFAVADKLLDNQAELLKIETEKGLRLVSPKEMEELRKTESFAEDDLQHLIPAGQPGIFTAETARKIHLVDLIAKDRVAAFRTLGFRPDDIKTATIPGEVGHAVRISINGIINADNTGSALRSIESAVKNALDEKNPVKVDFLCIDIDSPGGNIESSLNLASYLVKNVDSSKVKTVAYIPFQARSDAAIIAFACDEIVLGPGAVLGGDGAVVFSPAQIADAKMMIRDFLSKEALRSWSMPAAFVDPNVEVFKAVREGKPALTDYFCDEEFAQLPDAAMWRKENIIKPKGELLQIIGGKGEQYLVDRSAKDFAEFKMLYGLENDPMLIEPTWADHLVQVLSSPEMSALILFVVFIAVMIESKTPGIGIGAFIAMVGIVLYFWLNFLGGTSGWLEVSIFLVGVACLLLEIFVLPGFGIFGIGGVLAILASLVLASQTFIIPQNSYQFGQLRNSLLILTVAGAGVILVGSVLIHVLDKVTKPKDNELIQETEKLANYDFLLGQTGAAATPLVPAGKALIGGEIYDVVSEGSLIEKGTNIEVVEVIGYKIIVSYTEHT